MIAYAKRKILIEKGRKSLAEKVDHISKRDDSIGYDIQSYDMDGKMKYIEVKSTLKPVGFCNIYISANELAIAKSKDNYYFYVVYDVGNKNPKIWKIKGVDFLKDRHIEKEPILYKIKFKTK